ncbi:PAS domain-containing sensor histidine kinase [Methanooceanicella nereidis]|uniref:PAS domain-containing sensor histidine kinase n=1 Tax=Methanooceanicella nereidis TaxID=2052831 RepID=UPI001E28E343
MITLQLMEQKKHVDRHVSKIFSSIVVIYSIILIFFISRAVLENNPQVFNILILSAYLFFENIINNILLVLITVKRNDNIKHLYTTLIISIILLFIGDNAEIIEKMISPNLPQIFTDFGVLLYSFGFLFLTVGLILAAIIHVKRRADDMNKNLNDTLQFMDDLIMQSPDGVCIFDVRGNIIKTNDNFIQIMNIKTTEELKDINLFKSPKEFDMIPQTYIDKVKNGEAVSIPMSYLSGAENNGKDIYLYIKIFPANNSEGRISGYILIADDVSDIKRWEDEKKESEEKYRRIIDTSEEGICVIDENLNTLFVNQKLSEITGYTDTELIEGNPLDLVDGQYMDILLTNRDLNKKGIKKQFDLKCVKKDGSIFWVIVSSSPILDDNSAYKGSLYMITDITERKKAEDEIKRALDEKDILLKEVHHRVKNNLQIISSLLNLQSAQIKDKHDLQLFKDSQNRIRSMALIHEKLYGNDTFSTLNFQDYVRSLTTFLFNSYSNNKNLRLNFNINEINLNIDTAIPCGLIINELVSNSLKYAFPDNREGEIRIDAYIENDMFNLCVSDNGIGLPVDFDPNGSETLGIQLVNALATQLNGKMEINGNNGTDFRLVFNYSKTSMIEPKK